MKVTKVIIDKYEPKEKGTCAEVSVVLDNALVIHKISVVSGEKGNFITMPNTGRTKIRNEKKRYEDLVHPVCNKLSTEIANAVLMAYKDYTVKN